MRFSGSLLIDQPETFWGARVWSLDVCDAKGARLFTLRFSAEEAPGVDAVPYAPPSAN